MLYFFFALIFPLPHQQNFNDDFNVYLFVCCLCTLLCLHFVVVVFFLMLHIPIYVIMHIKLHKKQNKCNSTNLQMFENKRKIRLNKKFSFVLFSQQCLRHVVGSFAWPGTACCTWLTFRRDFVGFFFCSFGELLFNSWLLFFLRSIFCMLHGLL